MNTQKVLAAIVKAAPERRPGSVDPRDVKKLLDISDRDFAESLSELENAGYLTQIFGNNLLVDISITTKVPNK